MPSADISGTQITLCPACGSREASGQETAGTAMIERAGDKEFVQPSYQIRCCGTCGLYYKTVTLSPGELADYYRLVDFRKWETTGYFPTERATLEFLRGFPSGSRILDFGCSTGRLLSEIASDQQCFGFEVNAEAAKIAAGKGLRILSKEELFNGELTFDCIVLCDVFEHLDKPTELLAELCIRLRPGGILLLITGNADAPVCQRCPAMFWYFRTPQHLCMLSRRHADYICATLNLKLTCWQALCHYDLDWKGWLLAHARDFAYWHSRPNSHACLRFLVGCLPGFRRAQNWSNPPGLACTRDHVLAAFVKL
jgi:SAM-dependent methyltransferase